MGGGGQHATRLGNGCGRDYRKLKVAASAGVGEAIFTATCAGCTGHKPIELAFVGSFLVSDCKLVLLELSRPSNTEAPEPETARRPCGRCSDCGFIRPSTLQAKIRFHSCLDLIRQTEGQTGLVAAFTPQLLLIVLRVAQASREGSVAGDEMRRWHRPPRTSR